MPRMLQCESAVTVVYYLVSTETPRRSATLPWIATPIDERDGNPPHLYRRSDATPIELFFDLFFVANLSTFTATHEINNMDGSFRVSHFQGLDVSNIYL